METSIRLNSDNLSSDIIEGIKTMFPHKNIEIIIQSADETEYLLNDPDYSKELIKRIKEYNSKKETIIVKPNDLV